MEISAAFIWASIGSLRSPNELQHIKIDFDPSQTENFFFGDELNDFMDFFGDIIPIVHAHSNVLRAIR